MRWIIRLYPRGWRERYGGEMSELLDSAPLTPIQATDIALDATAHGLMLRPHNSPPSASGWACWRCCQPLFGVIALNVNWLHTSTGRCFYSFFSAIRIHHSITTLPLIGVALAVISMLRVGPSMQGGVNLTSSWRGQRLSVAVGAISASLLIYWALDRLWWLMTWPSYGP